MGRGVVRRVWGGADHSFRHLRITRLVESFADASAHAFRLHALLSREKAEGVARQALSSCFSRGRRLVIEAGRRSSSERVTRKVGEDATARSAGFLPYRSADTAVA